MIKISWFLTSKFFARENIEYSLEKKIERNNFLWLLKFVITNSRECPTITLFLLERINGNKLHSKSQVGQFIVIIIKNNIFDIYRVIFFHPDVYFQDQIENTIETIKTYYTVY